MTDAFPRLRVLLAAVLTAAAVLTTAGPSPATAGDATREVLFVGNNWDGTADIIDPVGMVPLERINVIPDMTERMLEILSSPDKFGYYLAIRALVGEGHDQYVDDMFTSHD